MRTLFALFLLLSFHSQCAHAKCSIFLGSFSDLNAGLTDITENMTAYLQKLHEDGFISTTDLEKMAKEIADKTKLSNPLQSNTNTLTRIRLFISNCLRII